MKVKDAMTREVKWVEVPGVSSDALDLMKKLGTNAVPVVRKDTEEFVGMVSAQTILENPDENQLAMLVDRDVPTISPDADLGEAAKLMFEKNVRRLPVLKEKKLVGILTVRDILRRVIAAMNIDKPAEEFMRPHMIAVWDGTPLKVAVHLLKLSGFRVLPVIDDEGKLVGKLSDTDVLKVSDVDISSTVGQLTGKSESDSWAWDTEARIYITKKELKLPDKLVRDVMSPKLITISRSTPVGEVSRMLAESRDNEAFVLGSSEELLGLVRDIDLLKVLF
ncbi:MAG: CBS domain-containing protein [Candidatus Hadarchaeales archaeon]